LTVDIYSKMELCTPTWLFYTFTRMIPGLVLIEVASWGLFLAAMSSHVVGRGGGGEVDELAYRPLRPLDRIYQPRGHSLSVSRHPVSLLLVGGGACQEEETSRGVVICWRVCPLRYLSYRTLHTVNGFYEAVPIPWHRHDDI
jgi:hypothetical protein